MGCLLAVIGAVLILGWFLFWAISKSDDVKPSSSQRPAYVQVDGQSQPEAAPRDYQAG
jgi:hypothetical protein